MIDQKLFDAKYAFDVPYDELYHKEKNLVQAVINAEKALKLKESTLPLPIGPERFIDPKNLNQNVDYLEF
jgi:hypothetical protein